MAAPGIVGQLPRPEGYRGHPRATGTRRRPGWTRSQTRQRARSTGCVASQTSPGAPRRTSRCRRLLKRPFAVRDAVPLGSAGATRMLDGIQQRLASGRGERDLRQALLSVGSALRGAAQRPAVRRRAGHRARGARGAGRVRHAHTGPVLRTPRRPTTSTPPSGPSTAGPTCPTRRSRSSTSARWALPPSSRQPASCPPWPAPRTCRAS